jgi:hypothetical protein
MAGKKSAGVTVSLFKYRDHFPGILLQVSSWWNAAYLHLHPTHYAIAITPDGRTINLKEWIQLRSCPEAYPALCGQAESGVGYASYFRKQPVMDHRYLWMLSPIA